MNRVLIDQEPLLSEVTPANGLAQGYLWLGLRD